MHSLKASDDCFSVVVRQPFPHECTWHRQFERAGVYSLEPHFAKPRSEWPVAEPLAEEIASIAELMLDTRARS